jgi:hypothetical protein
MVYFIVNGLISLFMEFSAHPTKCIYWRTFRTLFRLLQWLGRSLVHSLAGKFVYLILLLYRGSKSLSRRDWTRPVPLAALAAIIHARGPAHSAAAFAVLAAIQCGFHLKPLKCRGIGGVIIFFLFSIVPLQPHFPHGRRTTPTFFPSAQ